MVAMEKRDDAPILRCEDISLRFGGVNALLDITFEVNKGEILSIIGPNGAEETPGKRLQGDVDQNYQNSH